MQQSTGTRNKREAEKFLALRISEAQRGVYVKPVHVPLRELWERYFAYAKAHKRSWRRDEQMYGNLQISWHGKLDSITPLRVEEFQQRRGREVSPATVNRETALLKHMFNMAERWGLYQGTNPVRLVKFLPENNLQFRTLSEDEERALARILAALPPGADSVRDQYGPQMRRSVRSEMGGSGYRRKRLSLIMGKTRRRLEIPLNETAMEILRETGREAWALCLLQSGNGRQVSTT